ncbi:PAS domain-containing sensor histidine kinase [uncultured Maribacter sp.]|uniref:PAS domain-containing sensor histidine kinase n=1 Tax=uncultured Maribacter sp. TaxID=431308 RepID=UPI00260FBEEE|nr:PAS domain-containing sensor histidine kinase [uncultured Maribacter sp.]
MDSKEVILLKKALERQKKARQQAERILEEKSKELYDASLHLKQTNKVLENLLDQKTAQIDNVFVNIIDPYLIMDLKGNIIKMNSAAEEFLGFSKEENIKLTELIHPDYKEYSKASFKSLYTTGLIKKFRPGIITKNNELKFIEVNGSLIKDKKGNISGAQGVFRDITAELEMKNLLNTQRQRLDIIVEHSPLGIWLTSKDTLIKVNNTMQKMLGYTEEELRSINPMEITSLESLNASKEYREKLIKGEIDEFSVVKKYLRKDGSSFSAKTTVSAVRNIKGELRYEVALIEDITHEIELEEEKKQLVKDLESSNKGLQEYAHIVSHDLKSPLRSISALTTWMYEDYKDKLDDNGVYNLKMMQDKVESMDKLIDGILKYSTIKSDNLDNSIVDVNEVVQEIKDIIFIPDHVTVKTANKLPTIYADRTKIHQLIQNFLSNAVVHIEREKGLVEVGCEDRGTHWEFSVKDNGVGIPKEYHEKIFKIFQSIGNKERSTGIGLSIVKKIIDLYEGKVWLQSEIGKGTTFFFTLKKQNENTTSN